MRNKTLMELRQAVDTINITSDMNEWVNKYKTGDTKTARIAFQSQAGEKKQNLARMGSQKLLQSVRPQSVVGKAAAADSSKNVGSSDSKNQSGTQTPQERQGDTKNLAQALAVEAQRSLKNLQSVVEQQAAAPVEQAQAEIS